MKLFSNPRAVLGGLALSVSLAMFSSGASAVEIPICDQPTSNVCSDAPFAALIEGTNEFVFADNWFIGTPADGTLSLDIEIDGFDPGILISGGSLALNGGGSLAATGGAGFVGTTLSLTWDLTGSGALEIRGFSFSCADGTGDCDGDIDLGVGSFMLSYIFAVSGSSEDVLTLAQADATVDGPGVASLLWLGLVVTGLSSFVRRRPEIALAPC